MALWLLAATGATLVAAVLFVRWGRKLLRHLLWRLRNRLIVAYAFIAVIPIVLLLVLVQYGSRYFGEQVSIHLVNSELDRRVRLLENAARAIATARPAQREAAVDRTEAFLQQRFPGVQIVLDKDNRPTSAGEGLAVRGGRLFAWGRAVRDGLAVTVAAPLTRKWLASLIPGIGDVTMLGEQGRAPIRLHDSTDDESVLVPGAVNRLDHELLWGTYLPVAEWESHDASGRVLLSVHSRLSAVLDILFNQKTESPMPYFLKFWAVVFILVQAVSIVIGVSLTRTITGTVNEVYEGTRRVSQGDFSHRIRVEGSDQLAGLGESFNQMTAQLEQLIQVAKEKERIEAEIEIARGVQSQLFPKTMPTPARLRITGLCRPARSVSGDYYDCQQLSGSRLAIALGDVAGKGISAALLMASLQASLRGQLREAEEWPGSHCQPSRIVGRLNQHLHANTSAEKFATFFFAIYDDETGLMTYTNAGHLPPILVRAGKATPLEVTGMVVGAFPQAHYEERTLQLEPGDLLIAFSDGVTEPENEFGEMFGDHRFAETIAQCAGLEPQQVAETIADAAVKFTGSAELQDDLTLLVARRL